MKTKLLLLMLATALAGCVKQEVAATTASTDQSAANRAARAEAAKKAEIDQAVREMRVVLGMSVAQVRQVWGVPSRSSLTTTAQGTAETMYFSDRLTYATFADGVLVATSANR